MEKDKNLRQGVRHDKVVLQKNADHVDVSGPYTKKQLRRLLLSTISLAGSKKHDSTELDSTIKKKTGLSQVDLDKIKEGKVDEISREAERALKDIDVTEEIIRSIVRKKEDAIERKKKTEGEDLEREKKTEGEDLKKSEKSFEKFLRDKGLSESLVKSLIENGLTDEYVRLLKALGFTDTEIERLRMSWQDEIFDSTSLMDSEDSCASSTSSSDDDLSPEGLYLKHFLNKILARALRDIAAKKPYDPVEYLGHWLLHFKSCEERARRRKDFEMELMIERERYRMINIEDQEIMEIESGGQECDEDWITRLDP